MKLTITVESEVLAAAEWAMAAHSAALARHMAAHPNSPFHWEDALKLANDQTAAFKAACADAKVAEL